MRVWMVGGSRGEWEYERVLQREDIGQGENGLRVLAGWMGGQTAGDVAGLSVHACVCLYVVCVCVCMCAYACVCVCACVCAHLFACG